MKKIILLTIMVSVLLSSVGCTKNITQERTIDGIFITVIDEKIDDGNKVYEVEIENLSSEDLLDMTLSMNYDVTEEARVKNYPNVSSVEIFKLEQNTELKAGESLSFNMSFPKIIESDQNYNKESIEIDLSGYFRFVGDTSHFEMSGSIEGYSK